MTVLLDTNVLIYAHNADSPYHGSAKKLVYDAFLGRRPAAVAHQNLIEFYRAVTDTKYVATPLDHETAKRVVGLYLESPAIQKILPVAGTLARALALFQSERPSSKRIFDLYLAQTMLDNNVGEIVTANIDDFRGIPRLQVTRPF